MGRRSRRTSRDNNPRRVHAGVVNPVIQRLRPAVRDAAELLLEEAGAEVEGDAVEVANADDGLGDVAEAGVALDNGEGGQEGERSPGENSQGLDAKHEGVGGHVPRVGQRIFLPQLGEDVLLAGEGGVVQDVVS